MTKTLKIIFCRTKQALRLNLGIHHRGLNVYQVCSTDDRRLTFDFFTAGQICIPIYLYGENAEKSFSQNAFFYERLMAEIYNVVKGFGYNQIFVS